MTEFPDGRLSYRLKRPLRDGTLALILSPSELIRRLCTLVPPPRKHLVRFHGVFGPCSGWRRLVVPDPPGTSSGPSACLPTPGVPPTRSERPPCSPSTGAPAADKPPQSCASTFRWADLLRRVFAVDVLTCPCGGRRKVLAFLTEKAVIRRILDHLRLPTTGPPASSPETGEERELSGWAGPDHSAWQDDVPALQRSLQ